MARVVIVILFGLGCAGCWINGPSALDEEKDPNLLRGRSLFAMNNYSGAAESWEKALQSNPRNAEAYFELLVVNAQKLDDYATAIYYGNRFIKLKPNDRRMQIVTNIMGSCKQALAKDCFPGPVTQDLVNKFDKLDKENKSLKAQVELLNQKLYMATHPPVSNTVSNATPSQAVRMTNSPSNTPSPPTFNAAVQKQPAKPHKTYVVKPRDTAGRIAKDYNVSLNALIEANPGLNPKKIKVGQTLNIPVR